MENEENARWFAGNFPFEPVDLNTADLSALCTLPGVGEKRAQTILDYRTQNGPFERVEDAANVPGLTQTIVDSWAGMATVS